jgi:hypothetical protein
MIRPSKYRGEVSFDYDDSGKPVNIQYRNGGRSRLQWWGELKDGKPDLTHSYVIGCDISLGTGNSNSVAAILDFHTSEIVGTWVCPNTPYELFADTVYALGKWLGDAYIIFENNGGHGVNFGRRLVKHRYHRVYTQHHEDSKVRRPGNKWGWNSNPNTKADLLGELGIALSEGLKTSPSYIHCKIHDREILDELRRYVYYTDGDMGAGEFQDMTSGARKRHGDRVIAVGLCVLGSKYQNRIPPKAKPTFKPDTWSYRQMLAKKEEKNRRDRMIW